MPNKQVRLFYYRHRVCWSHDRRIAAKMLNGDYFMMITPIKAQWPKYLSKYPCLNQQDNPNKSTQ